MIVVRTEDGLELVTQPDHARLAADILSLWRADELPRHPRRAELLLAVREHDNGWRETDAAPRVDLDSGRPLDFRHLPPDERWRLWRRAVDRLAETPHAAALVAHHAIEIHRERTGDGWRQLRQEMASRRDDALELAALGADELKADYRFLDLADTLSLVACGAFDRARCRGHEILRRPEGVALDPFPLAGATTFEIPVREIADRSYADSTDLIGELATARWDRRPIRLTPGP